MNYEIVNLEEKVVVGITARTKNSDENMPQIIGGLWSDFYMKGIYNSIPNKVNEKSIGLYSDYENNENGEYNITVCTEVSDAKNSNSNVVVRVIPKGRYAKFIVKGHMQRAVSEFWMNLWTVNLERTFTGDFEEYQDCNEDSAEIHVYISIK